MQLVGFFREMDVRLDEVFTESIHEHLLRRTLYQKEQVIAYLKSGHPVFDITELTADVIGGKFHVAGGSSLLSDGENVWREDLAAYVEHYSIGLPPDFLQFIDSHEYVVQAVSRHRLIEVSRTAKELLGFRPSVGSGPKRIPGAA